MKIDITKKDVLWSYLGIILSMGANFLTLPFIIYYLDGESLGLWYVFISIGNIATLFDFGFSVTFARNVTYCWSGARKLSKVGLETSTEDSVDFKLFKKVLSACKLIYLFISLASMLFLFTAGTAYILNISMNFVGYNHIISWIVYASAVVLNVYYGYYTAFLRGVGAVGQANQNTVYARLVHILLTISLLYFGFGLLGACIAYLSYGTVFRILGKYKFYKYKNIGTSLSGVSEDYSFIELVDIISTIWHNAWRDGLIALSNFLSSQASTIICSIYLSLTETGIYSLGVQLASAISLISGAMYNTFQPTLQQAFARNDLEKMRKTMSIIVVSFLYVFLFLVVLVDIIGLPILRYIKSTAVVDNGVFLLLCVYQFVIMFRNIYTSYFSCTNRIIYMKSFLVSSVLCVSFSYIAIGYLKYGIVALVMAQLLSQLLFNIWYWPWKGNRELKLSLYEIINLGNKALKVQLAKLI